MRHYNATSIGKPDETAVETNPLPGGDDFLSRVNATITNFKELGKIFVQLRGETRSESEEQDEPAQETSHKTPANPQLRAPGLLDYMDLAIKSGYGDIPIGKLIEQVSPHTLRKVMEVFKNATGIRQ